LSGGNIAGSNEQDASPKLTTEDPFDLPVGATLQLAGSNQQRLPGEAQLQLALNLIPAHTWYALPSGALTFVNQRTADYLGLPNDHPLRLGIDTGADWDSHIPLLHPDDQEESRRVWSTCIRTGSAGQMSFRVRDVEGGYRWFLSRAEPVRASDGSLLYWIGVNLDIQDRKQAELYLAEGQRLAHTGSWAFNAAGFDYWSPELFRIHGLDPSGKAPTLDEYMALVHPDDREFVAETIQKMFAEHRGFDFTKRIVRPDGEIRRVRWVGDPATHSGAVQEFIGTGMDVTEQVLLTQEVGRREAYLAEAQRLSHTGSFGWDVSSGEIYWSDETFRIFELDPKTKITIDLIVQRTHPDDRLAVQQVIEGASTERKEFALEHRLLMPDGSIKYVHVVGHPSTDEGCPSEFVGAVTDITEQRRAEESLRKSEAFLAEAERLSHTGSCAWNVVTGEQTWSEENFRILGYDRSIKPTLELIRDRVHPDDRQMWQQTIARAAEGKEVDFESRLLMPDGSVKHVHVVADGVKKDGKLVEVIGTARDITERTRAEEAIRRSEAYLADAQRLSHTGSWAWSPEEGIKYWSEENYRVHGFDPRDGLPRFEEFFQRIHPDDQPKLMELRETLIREKIQVETDYRMIHPGGAVRDIHSSCYPVLGPSGDLIEVIGTVIDVTDRKRSEDELRRSEAYLADAQKLSHTGSWAMSPEVGIKYWSEECYRVLGFDPRDGLPRIQELFQRVHPDDQVELNEVQERAIREKVDVEVEYRIVHPSGAVRDIHSTGHSVLSPSGDLIELMGTVIDITDRKRAEEELRQSEAYLAEAQKLSQTGSWAWSPKKGIRYWSEECYRVLGFDPLDGLPRFEEFFQRVHPDDQVEFHEATRRAIREKLDFETEHRIVHPSGAVRDIHSIGHPVLGPSGDLIEFIGTVIDITERKRVEEELRASESKYRQLVDTTPAFVHTALPNGELDFLNHGWLEYVGVPLTDLLGWRWTSRIHPEDVEAFVEKWRASVRSGEPFLAESRVRRADGEYRWFMHHKEPLRNELGQIIKWYGSSIDIQERKIAEERIREQETELRQILDLTPQHISVLAPDGSRLYCNHTALEYFGITLEQWREPGRVPNELVHPEDREHFLAERNNQFLEGKPHEFEARLLRPGGEFRWFLIRLTPLKDEQGHITRWYGTATDIEDRKRAEEEIRKENIALREEIIKTSMFEEIVGNSPALQQVLVRVAKVAPTDSTVLITGETGTGKELIARAIHKSSKRSDRAFVSVNCAAIPPSLIPSELFGHEKGAFTGATGRRLGRFELAEGGTIFLDEVGELPPETQVALLRVLQEREFERVGGSRSIRANVRVIVATNRDLQAAMAAGTFREDLFYRLNVFPIEVPPLRQRREDIPLLVKYFIDRYARKEGKNIRSASKQTLELFQSYPWPGNVRELQNVIERSVIVCETESFSVDESWLSRQPQRARPTGQLELPQRLAAEEKQAIEAALSESGGRVFGPSGAAAKLGIARSTLESKIRTLKIDKNRFKLSNPSQEN
jgi:PAS domain S-box-containing protein